MKKVILVVLALCTFANGENFITKTDKHGNKQTIFMQNDKNAKETITSFSETISLTLMSIYKDKANWVKCIPEKTNPSICKITPIPPHITEKLYINDVERFLEMDKKGGRALHLQLSSIEKKGQPKEWIVFEIKTRQRKIIKDWSIPFKVGQEIYDYGLEKINE